MSFLMKKSYAKRFYYEAGARQTWEIPQGNLFSGMSLDINLEVDITVGVAANIPDFQIARAIQKLEILRNGTAMWSLSGEALAAKFRFMRGVEAPGNAGIAVAVANNVQGRMHLECPFSPEDAARPQDYALDSRGNEYELAITWRNLTVAGTLFGSVNTVTALPGENFIDFQFNKLELRPNVMGKDDSLSNMRPFMRGLREVVEDVTSTQDAYLITPSKLKQYRGLLIWATHMAAANQKVGLNTILTDKITIDDTQDTIYHNLQARAVREETALRWGVGSALPAGIYEIPLTAWGNIVDEVVSDNVIQLRVKPDVTKLANATQLHLIYDTTEKQS